MKGISAVLLAIFFIIGEGRCGHGSSTSVNGNIDTDLTDDAESLLEGKAGTMKLSAEEEMMIKVQRAFISCQAKHKLSEEEIDAMKNKDADYEYSHNAKCLFACMFKAVDLLQGGKFIKENVIHMSDVLNGDDFEEAAKSRKVIERCSEEDLEDEPDLCEYVYKMSMCWANDSQEK